MTDILFTLMGTSEKQVRYIIFNKDSFYHNFEIPKKNGKRIINAPNKTLKKIQRNILNNFLYAIDSHKNAFGFVKNRSIIDCAKKHKNKKIIFKTDIRNFFPSITSRRLQGLLEKLGYEKNWAYYFTELCTLNNCLPQGAPTSPYISNLICHRLDKRLTGLAKSLNLEYSRYADDITFSGGYISRKTIQLIERIIKEEDFKVARDKSYFLSKANRQVVTGLVVNDKVSLGREKYHKLKAIIYNCKTKGIDSQNRNKNKNFKKYLLGKISILKKIDIWKWYNLKRQIDNLRWEEYNPQEFFPKSKEAQLRIEILELIGAINKVTGKVFNEDISILKEIFKSADTVENFNFRIQKIYDSINMIKLDYFLQFLTEEDKKQNDINKAINVLKLFLIRKGKNPRTVYDTFKDIQILSAGLARHANKKLQKQIDIIYEKYSVDDLTTDYSDFFEKILINFRDSLKELFYSLK